MKKNKLKIRLLILVTLSVVFMNCQKKDDIEQVQEYDLYTQIGTDFTWEQLLNEKLIPIGVNSNGGVPGSEIDVKNDLIEQGPYANFPVEHGIRIHTVGNSAITRKDFYRWTRWYQEDGNTQVFRLFKGEHNVRNERIQAARIEAFSDVSWVKGEWNEWVGRYTIIKTDGVSEPHNCAIFQAKNNISDWGVMLNLTADGDIILNHRRHQPDVTIATNMTGKSFDVRIRDNGHDYEVYLDDEFVGSGYYERPEGKTSFRWGLYVGATDIGDDIMIFVTGATVNPD